MKIYEIKVKNFQRFHFYVNNGIITNVTDLENPHISLPSTTWDNDTLSFNKTNGIITDTVYILSHRVRKIDYEKCVKYCLRDHLIQMTLDVADSDETYNLFICRKKIDKVFLEIGMFAYKARGKIQSKKFQDIVDQYMNLKAFW